LSLPAGFALAHDHNNANIPTKHVALNVTLVASDFASM
jgi:hypothetical protein